MRLGSIGSSHISQAQSLQENNELFFNDWNNFSEVLLHVFNTNMNRAPTLSLSCKVFDSFKLDCPESIRSLFTMAASSA